MASINSNNTEKEDIDEVIIEIQEEWPKGEQIVATSSQYWRSNKIISPTTDFPPSYNSNPTNPPIGSEPAECYCAQDVFLSHSGKQKNFIRQLSRDLKNQGVSCFFDQDRECLPVGEDFPTRIFEAAKTCKVALLLLTPDFLESKWPILELSAFVEAKGTTNPNLKILPVFFMILPQVLKEFTADNEKWKQLENSENERAKWEKALNAIRRINGLKFSEGVDEVMFRDEIVKEIWRILPSPSPRYHVSGMQGQARMCQQVSDLFNTLDSEGKDIRIAGLYGIAGQGKTTVGKAFCNIKLGEFQGLVCHLDFSIGALIERVKLALQYLARCSELYLNTLTDQNKAQVEFYRRVKGQRVLLVLDNVTEESMEEVRFYVEAELGENSWILLCARSVDLLEKHFKIGKQSCMRVPELKEEEAVAILLKRASVDHSTLGADERAVAVNCAQRCSFKEVGVRDHKFHPLALKDFGGHLSSAHGSHLLSWVDKIEGMVERSGSGLEDLMALLGKAFDSMRPEYRTIFMLLTLYIPPNMSPHRVTQWLAVILNAEVCFTEKAVEDLCREAFIEESAPKIRIHDLFIKFAQSKSNEMRKWLWWKGNRKSTRRLISEENAGFELGRLEQCMDRRWSQIAPHDLKNLLVLQLVGVQKVKKLDLGEMRSLRSMTLHSCTDIKEVTGVENLQQLGWLQISEVNFKLPELSSLKHLQYLEIKFSGSLNVSHLEDVTVCDSLREVNVCCRSLLEFPRLKGRLENVEKVEFSVYNKVKGPFDCTECVELQSTVIESRSRLTALAKLSGYEKVSKTVLWDRDAVKACPDLDVPSALKSCSRTEIQVESFVALEVFPLKVSPALQSLVSCARLKNLQLWNLRKVKKLPNFKLLSKLTVLKLGMCGIRDPPDLASCELLEDVCFSTLENLRNFPNFLGLRKLKKLRIYNCWRVESPPHISGCNELQVFHLVYNDSMKGLPSMGESPQLENIKLSWQSDEVVIGSTGEEDVQSDLVEFEIRTFSNLGDVSAPKELKEWRWLEGKSIEGISYVRDRKKYYSITAPYESEGRSQVCGKVTVIGRVLIHPVLYLLVLMLVIFIASIICAWLLLWFFIIQAIIIWVFWGCFVVCWMCWVIGRVPIYSVRYLLVLVLVLVIFIAFFI